MININDYIKFKDTVKAMGEDMYGKNQRIYFDNVPDANSLPKIEKLLKAKKEVA